MIILKITLWQRVCSFSLWLVGFLFWLSLTEQSQAQIFQLDFGHSGTTASPVQSGWTSWELPTSGGTLLLKKSFTTSTAIAPSGTITVTLSNNFTLDGNGDLQASVTNPLAGRDRTNPPNSGSFTESDLYRDLITNVNNGSGIAFELSGLNPNYSYILRAYAYDSSASRTNTFKNITVGGTGSFNNSGEVSYTSGVGGYPTTNEQYSVFGALVSDSFGRLIVKNTEGSDGIAVLNGFSLAVAIPEPSAYFMSLFGFIIVVFLGKKAAQEIC